MRAVALAAALAAFVCGTAQAQPQASILDLGFEATDLRGPSTRVAGTIASTDAFRDLRSALKAPLAVVWGREGAAVLTMEGGQVRVVRSKKESGDLAALERGRDTLPASRIIGSGGLSAQFEMPSRDYAHDALGSPLHARVLAVTERRPSGPTSEPKPVAQDVARMPSGDGAVFEDREPHLWELGGGQTAFAAVRSYAGRGSALSLVAKREGAWRIVAETPPDGEPFRWLNPVTTGERSDPRLVALVRRPHLDGLLQLWRMDNDALVLRGEAAGFSNHVFGSPAQDLATWFLAADGASRLAVPSLDRTALVVLAVDPALKEIARVPLPAKASIGVVALGRGREAHLLVGLEDGRVAAIRP